MARIPRVPELDSSLALLREGYAFLRRRFLRQRSDVIELRFFGMPVIALRGEECARLFYDETRFVRRGAVPKRVRRTLIGDNGVQGLDDEAHAHRKAMFMSLMSPASIDALVRQVEREWDAAAARWQDRAEVTIADEAEVVMLRAACAWAGVPLRDAEAERRARDLAAMVDAFGAIGPRHWRGRLARRRSEAWIAHLVDRVRSRTLSPAPGTALHTIAWHRELDGSRLSLHDAAVEVLNVLRPIVAISTWVTFGALALHQHAEPRARVERGEDGYITLFVQEVRRFYPFTPFVGAKVRQTFDWRGYRFPKGRHVLLDVHGTLRDDRLFDAPHAFRPDRFRSWTGSPFGFIPQGGGDHATGHRCAGEHITIEVMKASLDFLARRVSYTVPQQDLGYSIGRIPTIPRSRFVVRDVRRTRASDEASRVTRPSAPQPV